jgi:hypothetical protein
MIQPLCPAAPAAPAAPVPPASSAKTRAKARQLQRNRSRGAVMVEYAFLLVGFCVPVMAATAAAGVQLVHGYGLIRDNMLHKGP